MWIFAMKGKYELSAAFNNWILIQWYHSFFKKDFISSVLDRGEGRVEERERNINVWLSHAPPSGGDLAQNPGMCPDWESNQWPFGLQAGLSPLSHTILGNNSILIIKTIYEKKPVT